uniref:TOM1-like protein 2 n=1 Tax=Caenorhabditis tropicalis TaxID=1561998 RepID=A0A1I7TIG7_9PELO
MAEKPRRMSNVSEQVSKAAESARETVAKVGESVSDFFQGNPFATPVGRKIELATDANLLATENWGLNMEICDFINGTEDGPRDAVRAIKKRLHNAMSKNNAVVMYTLTVLETAVKNCNHQFHVLVCNKDFVQDLVKLIGPKFDAPQIIQERVLSLIQAWADAFRGDPTLAGVVQSYDDLKSKGVEFPAADLDTLAPIKTPKRTVFNQPSPPTLDEQHQPPPQGQPQQHAPVQNPNTTYDVLTIREQGQEPISATPAQLTKLRADLDVVNQNIKVFRETLTDVVPRKETADELQLLSDLNDSCRQMQQRVLDLIRYVSNEEVTYELLMVNDSLNSVFEKYDRFVQNRQGEQQVAEARDLIDMGDGKSLGDQLSALKVTAANGGPATSASSSQEAYKANAEPQTEGGLAAAVSNKLPTENEAAEMEKWLETQSEKKTKEQEENDKL